MREILRILRFLLRGEQSGRAFAIRLVGLLAMIGIVYAILMLRGPAARPPSREPALPTQTAFVVRGQLPLRGEVSDVLIEPTERHAWQIEAEGGEYVNLRVRGEIDSTLEIIPPGVGRSTGIDFSSGGGIDAFLCMQLLRTPGLYNIIVSSYLGSSSRATGAYTFSVEPARFDEARPITAGDTLTGRVDTCDGDFYTLAVTAGQTFTVTAIPEPGRDVFVRLYRSRTDSDSLDISRSQTDSAGRAIDVLSFTATTAGTLFLNVSSQVDAPPADYSIRVTSP